MKRLVGLAARLRLQPVAAPCPSARSPRPANRPRSGEPQPGAAASGSTIRRSSNKLLRVSSSGSNSNIQPMTSGSSRCHCSRGVTRVPTFRSALTSPLAARILTASRYAARDTCSRPLVSISPCRTSPGRWRPDTICRPMSRAITPGILRAFRPERALIPLKKGLTVIVIFSSPEAWPAIMSDNATGGNSAAGWREQGEREPVPSAPLARNQELGAPSPVFVGLLPGAAAITTRKEVVL